MVHREDLPGALVEDLDPFGEPQTLMAGDENCFAWDDDSAEALACNDINRIPPQIEIDDPIANNPEENAAQLTHTPNPVDTPVPHFHNCAKHVENNLLEKFKFGEHLRDLFRQAVHSWHPLQKLQCFNEIGHLQNVPVVEVLSTTTHQLVGEPSRQTLHNRTVFSPQTPATFKLKVTKNNNAFLNLTCARQCVV